MFEGLIGIAMYMLKYYKKEKRLYVYASLKKKDKKNKNKKISLCFQAIT